MPRIARLMTLIAVLTTASCNSSRTTSFKDDAAPNTNVTPEQMELSFVDHDGQSLDLRKYRGKKHVVLVVTRGYSGRLCPYCGAQTSSLIANYDEFARREAEVLVVFPGPKTQASDFVEQARQEASAATVRFPVLLDEDFRAVERLGIRGDLAKPSTYILRKDGRVHFAYVGSSPTDRPSIKRLLKALDELQSP